MVVADRLRTAHNLTPPLANMHRSELPLLAFWPAMLLMAERRANDNLESYFLHELLCWTRLNPGYGLCSCSGLPQQRILF